MITAWEYTPYPLVPSLPRDHPIPLEVLDGREQWVPGDTTGSYRRTVMYHIFMEYII